MSGKTFQGPKKTNSATEVLLNDSPMHIQNLRLKSVKYLDMRRTGTIGFSFLFTICLLLASPFTATAQDKGSLINHGRKYKPPPATSRIEVLVTRKSNGKPIPNAAVVFNPTKDGKDEGSLEVKTDPDGKAVVDVIPTGSMVRVQIIANGFATFADDFQVNEPNREIAVEMAPPKAQISTYKDNSGKDSDRKVGVQDDPETVQRHQSTDTKTPAQGTAPAPATTPASPASSTPAPAADSQKKQ
jgi:hypothetical protein